MADDLFKEVLEEHSREQMNDSIRRYVPYIITAFLVVLFISIGHYLWQQYKTDKIHEEGSDFITAYLKLAARSTDDAIRRLGFLSRHGSTTYKDIALCNHTSLMALIKKDYELAQEGYDAIEKDQRMDAVFKEYMRLGAIINMNAAGKIDNQEVIERLQQYIINNSIFKITALEILASFQFKEKKYDEADNILRDIIGTPNISWYTSNRCETMISAIKKAQHYSHKK